MSSLKTVNVRVPLVALGDILERVVEQLLPGELRAERVSIFGDELEAFPGQPGYDVPSRFLSVSVKSSGVSREMFGATEYHSALDGRIDVSKFGCVRWREGEFSNQSFFYMKARLIEHQFSSAVRKYIRDNPKKVAHIS